MAGKIIIMLKRYKGVDGRLYEKGRAYKVSKQVAESWVDRVGRAEYAEGYKMEGHHALKAFERAPMHQAHDRPMEMKSNVDTRGKANVLKDPVEDKDPRKSPHRELPGFHIDTMEQTDLLQWLDDNVKEHGYDKRFSVNTLRQAVKMEVGKKHTRENRENT